MNSDTHLSTELSILGQYLTGEFTNQQQALAQPVWFVHLHLWFRRVSLFSEDSITLFTEQASLVNFNQPYRPRLLRLRQDSLSQKISVQYYQLRDMEKFKGGGRYPEKLEMLTAQDIDLLTHVGCFLPVTVSQIGGQSYQFKALPTTDEPCCFTYQHQTYQIALGFEVNEKTYISYEKGINSQTGKASWGTMGAYSFEKIQ